MDYIRVYVNRTHILTASADLLSTGFCNVNFSLEIDVLWLPYYRIHFRSQHIWGVCNVTRVLSSNGLNGPFFVHSLSVFFRINQEKNPNHVAVDNWVEFKLWKFLFFSLLAAPKWWKLNRLNDKHIGIPGISSAILKYLNHEKCRVSLRRCVPWYN